MTWRGPPATVLYLNPMVIMATLRYNGAGQVMAGNVASPLLTFSKEEVERRDSLEAVQIDVVDEEGGGKVGRFWVSVRVNNQGRPVVLVSTEPAFGDSVTKSLVGRFRTLQTEDTDGS